MKTTVRLPDRFDFIVPAAVLAAAWLLFLGLAPFSAFPAAESDWLRALTESAGNGVWRWHHVAAAFWSGLFWQLWAGRSNKRALTSFVSLIGLSLFVWAISTAQSIYPPLWTTPFGWPGHIVGITLGMLAATAIGRTPENFVSAYQLHGLWRGTYLLSGMLSFSTMVAPSEAGAWLPAISDHLYLIIKAAIIWLPFGGLLGLLGLAMPARVWVITGVSVLLLVGHVDLGQLSNHDWLEVFVAAPGLAFGFWLGENVRRLPGWQVDETAAKTTTDERDGNAVADVPPAPEMRRDRCDATVPEKSRQSVRPLPLEARKPVNWAIGSLLLAGVAVALFDFPLAAWLMAFGLLAFALLLWWQPLAWLLVVPAALPVLDLAPWSGRFFLDEFDLLMTVALAMLILRASPAQRLSWPPLAHLAIAAFFGLALVSGGIGLADWPTIDANAFTNYWSPYNSLRVAKGFVWGGVFLFLVRRSCDDIERFTRWLAVGMGLGLLAVCLVGVWERWLYSGLTDLDATYRIVGLFSSMHTGGGHIEAYLAAALPFLWLGLRHWKTALLAMPLLALATYVLIYTVSRGGALAFGIIFIILATGSARLAWVKADRRGIFLPILALAAAAAILLAGVGGGYFQQRFSQTAEDTQTRLTHWHETLAMTDDSWRTTLFGMGLGSFPRIFLERGAADKRPATYAFVPSRTGQALRLGTGATLYYAQRTQVSSHTSYRLLLDVRAESGPARLDVPICEKQMLNSYRCVWPALNVPGDGVWRRYEHIIQSGEVGAGNVLSHLPTEFVLSNVGKTGVLEIDNVQLFDPQGRNLLRNGNFEAAGDAWFFKTHSHLPWHIKNVWMHLVFEMGWLGLFSFLMLTGLALARAAKAAWRGQPLAWVLLAVMAGMLSIGLFDSLLDAPRLTMLLLGSSLIAIAPPWAPRRSLAKRRKRHRHAW